MSIWTRISDALQALAAGEGLSAVFEKLVTPPDKTVGFAIAVIALGAKMAKADGLVTKDEVTAFREVFHIARNDEANAAKVFDLARRDVAGYDTYARQIKRLFGDDQPVLEDLMEGLFHIAIADGEYHPNENEFLKNVSEIFGIGERCFRSMRNRFVPDAAPDPYDVLGLPDNASYDEAKVAWRRLVRETHPDQMVARGVPEEAVKLAQTRMIAINRAWEDITKTHVV
ncbi:MAG: TerB family tellurite resistance protein [Planktomarina sp.]